MFNKFFFQRLSVILMVGLLVFSFVACKKNKDNKDDQSSTTSTSSTGQSDNIDQTVSNGNTDVSSKVDLGVDYADKITSSEFEKIEEEFIETVKPQIEKPVYNTSSSVSSTVSVSSAVSSGSSASTSMPTSTNSSSSVTDVSSQPSASEDASSSEISSENVSSAKPSPGSDYVNGWY